VRNFNFKIEHKCPTCGAPAMLEETDRLFACPFCRVRSFLLEHEYFRYTLPYPDKSGNGRIFFPYWRFKGTFYSSGPSGTEHKFIDLSRQAAGSDYFPASLGLRSQALKLKFALPETTGQFIRPSVPLEEVVRSIRKIFLPQTEADNRIETFTGRTASIIYAPFIIKNKRLYDAILDAPASPPLPGNFDTGGHAYEKPDWPITFIPAICPACGWDLSGERDSIVLLCGNCDSAWHNRNRGFEKIGIGHIQGESIESLFLPFWVIKTEIAGIDYEAERKFWIPAFKVRAHHFLRIAQQMTFVQPSGISPGKAPAGKTHHMTIPLTEAVESIKTVLAGFIKPEKDLFPLLADAVLIPESYHLVFVPFITGPHDLIFEKYNIALNNNVLSTAGNL
jgi:predicted RNA-binding Zn-ribbon protein involved in translation (DUF1610 family)